MSFENVPHMAINMSRKEFERLLQKNLTHSQYVRMRETDAYLNKLFETVQLNEITKHEKRRIAGLIKQQNQDIWDLIFAGCLGDALACYPALNSEQRHKFAWNKAEVLMLQELYSPPHFTKEGMCNECGPVLLPESAINTDPLNQCPWCSVGMLGNFYKQRGEYEQ